MDTVKGLNRIKSSKKRYRFETLAEKAKRSNVNVAKQIQPDHELILEKSSGPDGCFTKQVLDSLVEYDRSREFQSFSEPIVPMVQTMPLLLHNLGKVVKALLKALERKGIATESYLKLVAVVAKDVRSSLYPHVPKLVGVLFSLVDPLDVKHDKQLFGTVGEIFVHVGAHIVSEDPELKLLRPFLIRLLGHRKDFIRRFAGETLAFLLRKLRNKYCKIQVRLLAIVLASQNTLDRNEEVQEMLCDGVAQLLYNTMKNVQHTFHSRSKQVLETLVAVYRPKTAKENGELRLDVSALEQAKLVEHRAEFEARAKCVEKTMFHMREYTRAEHCQVVWEALRAETGRAIDLWFVTEKQVSSPSAKLAAGADTMMEEVGNYLGRLLEQLSLWVLHRGGTRVSKGEPAEIAVILAQLFQGMDGRAALAKHPLVSSFLLKSALDLLFKTWYYTSRKSSTIPSVYRDVRNLVSAVYAVPLEAHGSAEVSQDQLVIINDFTLTTVSRMEKKEFMQTALEPFCTFCDSLLDDAGKNGAAFNAQDSLRVSLVLHALARVGQVVASSQAREVYSARISASSRMNLARGEHGVSRAGCSKLLVAVLRSFKTKHLEAPDSVRMVYEVLDTLHWADFDDGAEARRAEVLDALHHFLTGPLNFHTKGKAFTTEASLLHTKATVALASQLSLASTGESSSSGKKKKGTSKVPMEKILENAFFQLERNPHHAATLESCAQLVKSLSIGAKSGARVTLGKRTPSSFVMPLVAKLRRNLTHRDHAVRLHSLSLLNTLPRVPFEVHQDDAEATEESCPLIEVLLQLESMPLTYGNERKISSTMDILCMWMRAGKFPKSYQTTFAHYLHGMMHIKFLPMWKAAVKGLSVFAAKEDFDGVLWPILRDHVVIVSHLKDSLDDEADVELREEEESGLGFVNRYDDTRTKQQTHNTKFTSQTPALEFDKLVHATKSGAISRRSTLPEHLFQTTMDALFEIVKFAEPKNRDLIGLFLRFLHEQYYQGQRREDLDAPDLKTSEAELAEIGVSVTGVELATGIPLSFYSSATLSELQEQVDPNKAVYKRLVSWLTLFSKFSNLRSCWKHEELEHIFTKMLVKSNENIQTLCMTCILNMNNKDLGQYRDHLLALTREEEYRNEMTNFTLGEESVIAPQYRGMVIPLVVRVLFGKLLVRKGKSTSKAKFSIANRRAAILAFFASLSPSELSVVFRVIFRPFRDYEIPQTPKQDSGMVTESSVQSTMKQLKPDKVSMTRLMGFARLLEDVVKQLGESVEPFLPHLLSATLSILHWLGTTVAERIAAEAAARDGDTEMEAGDQDESDASSAGGDDEDASLHEEEVVELGKRQRKEISVLRNTLLLRLAEMFDRFPSYNYLPWQPVLLGVLQPLSAQLPVSMINARAPSAMLKCVHTVSQHRQLWFLLEDSRIALVPMAIRCLGAGLGRSSSSGLANQGPGPMVVSAVLQVVENLLDLEAEEGGSGRGRLLRPHMDLLLSQFQLRFKEHASGGVSGGFTKQIAAQTGKVGLRDARATQQSTISKRELDILSAVASIYKDSAARGGKAGQRSGTCSLILELLLPFLRFVDAKGRKGGRGRSGETDARDSVLATVAQLMPMAMEPLKHFAFLSKLLGPFGTDSITSHDARANLVAVFRAIASREDLRWMEPLSELLEDMNAFDKSRMNEYDFDRRLGAYEKINSVRFRQKVLWAKGKEVNLWVPVIYQMMQDMHDDEYSLRNSALNTLTDIIKATDLENTSTNGGEMDLGELVSNASSWHKNEVPLNVISNYILVGIKDGVRTQNPTSRYGFVCLAAEMVRQVHIRRETVEADVQKSLHGDLGVLLDLSDPEQDFFANLQHVQLHRRVAAMTRLRKRLLNDREQEPRMIQVSSLVHIIQPLIMHFVFESAKTSERNMQEESLVTLGTIAGHLSWSHYLKLLRQVLLQIPMKPTLSKQLIKLACLILDNFHFDQNCDRRIGDMDIAGSDEEDSGLEAAVEMKMTRIQQSLLTVVFPMLSQHLTAKVGVKEKTTIRTTVAIAMVKILKLVPERIMKAKLPGLLHKICGVLRSREQDARLEARQTLAQVAVELGPKYLKMVVTELQSTLVEGYQMHVLGSALYVLLSAMESSCAAAVLERNKTLAVPMDKLPRKSEETDQDTQEEILEKSSSQDVAEDDDMGDDPLRSNNEDEVVQALSLKVPLAPMDHAAPIIVEIIAKELFGDVGAQKSHDSDYKSKVKNLKEAKVSHGYESLEILSRTISFLPVGTIHSVLAPFLARIKSTDEVKELRIAEEAIRRIGVGLTKNRDVRVPHLLVYVHHLLTEHRDAKFALPSTVQKSGSSSEGTKVGVWLVNESLLVQRQAQEQVKARKAYKDMQLVEDAPQLTGHNRYENKKRRKRNARANSHFVVQHALEMLLGSLKQRSVRPSSEVHVHMLDPLLPMIASLVDRSKATRVCVLSLRALNYLISWPLDSLQAIVPSTCSRVLKLFQLVGNTNATGGGSSSSVVGSRASTMVDVKQACYRWLTGVLKRCEYYKLEEKHLKYVVVMLQVDVENVQRQNATFGLLKAIVARRVASPELYDLMIQLSRMLFRAHRKELRESCASTLVDFLIHYPLGAKRLQEHLDLIVKNLEYEFEDGRLSGLQIIHAIVRKFPEEKVDDLSQYLFFPLAARLVNDDSPKCKEKVGENVRLLFSKIGLNEMKSILSILEKWIKADAGQSLQRIAAQAFGLMMEARGSQMRKAYKTNTTRLVNDIVAILQSGASKINADTEEEEAYDSDADESQSVNLDWTTIYYCLLALQKVFQVPSGLDEMILGASGAYPVVVNLLEHKHAWVRLAAARFVGIVFSRAEPEKADKIVVNLSSATSILMRPGVVFDTGLRLCRQLASDLLSESLADQCTKNIVWVFRFLYNYPELSGATEQTLSKEDDDEEEKDDKEPVPARLKGVNWLVHRLSFLARSRSRAFKVTAARKTAVFKSFGAFALRLKKQDLDRFLVKLIFPLYRQVERSNQKQDRPFRRGPAKTLEQQQMKQEDEKLAELASEVLDVLQSKCTSPQVYMRAYGSVRELVAQKREERANKLAQEKITNPARAAERTKRKNLVKRENAKRKRKRLREMSAR